MAQYTVTFSCGHTGTVRLAKSRRYRERQIKWYESEWLCPECYKAERAKRIAELNVGLPKLIGTEKQVAWAEQIRADKFPLWKFYGEYVDERIEAACEAVRNEAKLMETATSMGLTREEFLAKLKEEIESAKTRSPYYELYHRGLTETSASWWIEHRNGGIAQ